MTKSELENKHISELHSLAAEAGVERFRLLSKAELVERLADGDDGGSESAGGSRRSRSGRGGREGARGGREQGSRGESRGDREQRGGRGEGDREQRSESEGTREPRGGRGESEGGESRQRSRRRRSRGPRDGSARGDDASREGDTARTGDSRREERPAAEKRERARSDREEKPDEPPAEAREPAAASSPAAAAEEGAKPRRRRRRRFGRRGKQGVTLQGLLLPPEAGRQALLLAESREACTALLRSVAADLAADSKGPDPVALLIDPSPEELGDWKREAPQAEIVAAGQPRHADDALAQAKSRAAAGEDVILLVDSLTRLGEAYGDSDAAKDFFDAGRLQGSTGGGSLTVVAALERS